MRGGGNCMNDMEQGKEQDAEQEIVYAEKLLTYEEEPFTIH